MKVKIVDNVLLPDIGFAARNNQHEASCVGCMHLEHVRLEIKGKDEFWVRAFHVEWGHQFPNRQLTLDSSGHYIAERDWLVDLENVAAQTFCRVVSAPDNPQRRRWMNSLIARR